MLFDLRLVINYHILSSLSTGLQKSKSTLRLANSNYVTNFLQSNTYLQQPKLPACCDFLWALGRKYSTKKGPRPESIRSNI